MPSAELYLYTVTLYLLNADEESVGVTDVDATTGKIHKYSNTVYTWYMIVTDDEDVRWIVHIREAFGKFLAWYFTSVTNSQTLSCLASF